MHTRIISIGALGAHPLWNEREPVRTGHATTTLITTDAARIIVDPGLPAPILIHRLAERANITPTDITHVFLTSFHPDTRRGIAAFDNATWWISQQEREGVGVPMIQRLQQAAAENEQELKAMLELDIAILKRCESVPDHLAPNVDLFPLPGVSPGLSGLIIADPRNTTLITGDALPTWEHIEQGKVLPWSANVEQARESFAEAIEIADLIIPGRDNIVVNPTKRPF